MEKSKLIILRGPSGAGKSTIARALHESVSRPTALIEQDYYREVMFRIKEATADVRREMLVMNTLLALNRGCDVILEGILSVNAYEDCFEEIFREHPTENYMFFFDVSLEETIRRHAQREKSQQFGAKEMKQWYKFGQRSSYEFEEIITRTMTVDQSVFFIKKTAGL